jgi:60 kDa SS-A/Ro ribonucleoprotein
LTSAHWKKIALHACERKSVQAVISNLNTFVRHKALDSEVATAIQRMLEDETAICGTAGKPSKLFPYKIWTAYQFADDVPTSVRRGLAAAIDLSLKNVPEFEGKIVVCPDVSGSMDSPVTGDRGTATTKVSCRHLAALISAVFLKKNPDNTKIIPFAERLFLDIAKEFDPLDTVATNVDRINSLPGGGTDVHLPLEHINRQGMTPDLVVYISDMQSWMDSGPSYGYGQTTGAMAEWVTLKKRNPKAKVIWINLQAYGTVQMPNRQDALNIGGFSDSVFEAMNAFCRSKDPDEWVKEIKAYWE